MIALADIQGHWARRWIKAPGFEDETTRVHWIQAGRDFADVRIPLERPHIEGNACLADLPPQALYALAQAEGFAGHVTLEGDHCTWHREINWHGPPDAPDIGAISFDGAGRMVEAGVLADYTELWEPRGSGATTALRFEGGGYCGLALMAGARGVIGIGRAQKLATRAQLQALKDGRIPQDVEEIFDGVHALCRIQGGVFAAELATNPFAEGKPVLSLQDQSATWHRTAFGGGESALELNIKAGGA